MENANEIIIKLIKSAITNTKDFTIKKEDITEELLNEIYKIASTQDLCHLVSQALYINEFADSNSEIGKKFFQKRLEILFRSEQQKFELKRISELFEELQIEFIPLKGSVLRNYYPELWMRTSCDIDILIKPQNLEKCIESLKARFKYTEGKKGEYDISLYSPSKMHLELHFGLMENMFAASKSLNKIWDLVIPIGEGKYEYIMPDDMFYYHQVVHMAKHFEYGGCGIRFFIDLWIMNHNSEFNKTSKYRKYLEEVSLLKFEEAAVYLSEVWFSSKQHNKLSLQIQEYVIDSGLYGDSQNLMATKQLKSGGKFKYAFSRIFMDYDRLCTLYPVLLKRRYLVPFYQIKRWVSIICAGRAGRSIGELQLNVSVTKDRKENISSLFDDLGF